MRTYSIMKEKVAQWNSDAEIQALVEEIVSDKDGYADKVGKYSADKAAALKAIEFDRPALGARGMKYEKLDQLTIELLLGVR